MNNAMDYAKKQADTFRDTLSYLVDKQNEQTKLKESLAKTNYENLVNQINSAKANLEQTYEENARQAYVNKLLGAQEIGAGISRMGLSDSGFRATQDVLNNNQYSANLNKLALDRATGLRGVEDQLVGAQNSYNANLLDIQADANDRLTSLNQYIENQVAGRYNDAFNQYMTNAEFNAKLQQQRYENSLKERELALLYGTGTGTGNGNGDGNGTGNGTTTGTGTGGGTGTGTGNGDGTNGTNNGNGTNVTGKDKYVNGSKLREYPNATVSSVFGTGMALSKDYLGIDATISGKSKIYQAGNNKFYVLVKDSNGNELPIDITNYITIKNNQWMSGSGNKSANYKTLAPTNKKQSTLSNTRNSQILEDLEKRKQSKDITSIRR